MKNLKIISASRSFYRDFQTTPEDTVGRPQYTAWAINSGIIPKLREFTGKHPAAEPEFEGYEVEHDFAAIGHCACCSTPAASVRQYRDTKMILLARMEKNP